MSFNVTLVSGEKPPLPAPVDVGALLRTALADAAAWNAVMPGTGERPVAPVYEDGEKTVTLKGEHIAEEFQALIERYIERKYPRRA